MPVLLDNLIATLVAGVVIMMMIASQTRATERSIERTSVYVAKTQALEFVEWFEDDIVRLGLNIPLRDNRFLLPAYEDGITRQFIFHSDSISVNRDTLRVITRYEVEPTGTTQLVDESERTLYQLSRYTATVAVSNGGMTGSPQYVLSGQSPPTLSHFDVQLLRRDGHPAVNSGETDYVNIRLSSISRPGSRPRNFLPEFHWMTSMKVRPF